VLDELERLNESIAAYLKAVTLSPAYADAHYNLALAYERIGQQRPALRHWRAYVKLDNRGPWPITPAARLASCSAAKSSPSSPAPAASSLRVRHGGAQAGVNSARSDRFALRRSHFYTSAQ